MSWSSFVVTRFWRAGREVAFAGRKMSSGIMGALYSYSTCVEVGSSLEGGPVQRSSLVWEA